MKGTLNLYIPEAILESHVQVKQEGFSLGSLTQQGPPSNAGPSLGLTQLNRRGTGLGVGHPPIVHWYKTAVHSLLPSEMF